MQQDDAKVAATDDGPALSADRERLAATRVVRVPRKPRDNPFIARSDFLVARRLLSLLFAARQPPEAWPAICRQLAEREFAAPNDGETVVTARIMRATGSDCIAAQRLAVSARAARHESAVAVLRGHLPGGWHPAISLQGREHLDAALAAGRGAVLWMAHFAPAGTVVKMAIHDAGCRLGHFSRPEHGFSKTRVGIAVLNPIRTSFENRYLTGRFVYQRDEPGRAMLAMRQLLAENGAVTMTAGAWEGSRMVEAPFLGSTIRLAAGPERVARESGAALLPVFGIKTGPPDSFMVRVGVKIELPRDGSDDEAARIATHAFVTALAPVVLAYPDQWRGWSSLIDPPPSA